jgi:hypothetical protein
MILLCSNRLFVAAPGVSDSPTSIPLPLAFLPKFDRISFSLPSTSIASPSARSILFFSTRLPVPVHADPLVAEVLELVLEDGVLRPIDLDGRVVAVLDRVLLDRVAGAALVDVDAPAAARGAVLLDEVAAAVEVDRVVGDPLEAVLRDPGAGDRTLAVVEVDAVVPLAVEAILLDQHVRAGIDADAVECAAVQLAAPDHDVVRADDLDVVLETVREYEPIDDDLRGVLDSDRHSGVVAVDRRMRLAPQCDVRLPADDDRLVVGPLRDVDYVARPGGIDRGLDGREVGGNAQCVGVRGHGDQSENGDPCEAGQHRVHPRGAARGRAGILSWPSAARKTQTVAMRAGPERGPNSFRFLPGCLAALVAPWLPTTRSWPGQCASAGLQHRLSLIDSAGLENGVALATRFSRDLDVLVNPLCGCEKTERR